uniref:Transcription initiation factor TFIID subunit 12 n=1 Tax=Steinernema glaseri TaxID=37863 RepID=A0A1I7ZHQ1_9BILA
MGRPPKVRVQSRNARGQKAATPVMHNMGRAPQGQVRQLMISTSTNRNPQLPIPQHMYQPPPHQVQQHSAINPVDCDYCDSESSMSHELSRTAMVTQGPTPQLYLSTYNDRDRTNLMPQTRYHNAPPTSRESHTSEGFGPPMLFPNTSTNGMDRAPQRRPQQQFVAPQQQDGQNPQVRYQTAPQQQDSQNPQVRYQNAPQQHDSQNPQVRYQNAPQQQDNQNPQVRYQNAPQQVTYEMQPMDEGNEYATHARAPTAQQQHPTVSALLRHGMNPTQQVQFSQGNPPTSQQQMQTTISGVPLVISGGAQQHQVMSTQPQIIIAQGGRQMYIQTSSAGGQQQQQYATIQQHLQPSQSQQQHVFIQQQPPQQQQHIIVQKPPQPQIQYVDRVIDPASHPVYNSGRSMTSDNTQRPPIVHMMAPGMPTPALPRGSPNVAQDEINRFIMSTHPGSNEIPGSSGQLLDTAKLEEIAKQVDSTANLDDGVKEALVSYIDEYINMVIDKAADVARHRGARRIEHKDVAYALKNFFDMGDLATQSLLAAENHINPPTVQDVMNQSGPAPSTNAHNQRMSLIKKTLKKP